MQFFTTYEQHMSSTKTLPKSTQTANKNKDTQMYTLFLILCPLVNGIIIISLWTLTLFWGMSTGSPLIGRKNGSIFLTNRLMRTVNKTAVLWEDLKNLLNKAKPSYREIRPMRGRLMRGPPVLVSNPKHQLG